jgi:murein DD-endopeptidase MepM/ murein hydrolase activator NlpD
LIAVASALMLFTPYFEIGKPQIRPAGSLGPIGQLKRLVVDFSDEKSGLRHVDITLSQDGRSVTLATFDFPERGTKTKNISLDVSPHALTLHDGEATMTLTAIDHSLFKNTHRIVEAITIETTPPQIALLSSSHNFNTGGTGLVVYRVSKPVEKTGVQVGQDFFAAYPIPLGGKPGFVVYFPVPSDSEKSSIRITVSARDRGGNEAVASVPHHLKAKKFRKDHVELTETFMSLKMPEFQQADSRLRGKSPVETFVFVNETMRDENFKTIISLTQKTAGEQLWKGPFLRMKNAAPMALFGDRRTYGYEKKKIGESVHLGVDLASTAHAPIEAANSGNVVFKGPLGIYGNAVIIDHGLGIFSLYAHLSEMKVTEGQPVAKGDIIGISGSTGLAGGDHLHFSMLVGGRFVNPIEWWDPHWLQDNVDKKFAEAS